MSKNELSHESVSRYYAVRKECRMRLTEEAFTARIHNHVEDESREYALCCSCQDRVEPWELHCSLCEPDDVWVTEWEDWYPLSER
jgi:hypothetical protein